MSPNLKYLSSQDGNINERGEINFDKWIEKVKDFCGFVKWVVGVFGTSAHIVRAYSPTWTRAYVWLNCVYEGGVGFGVNSKHMWETKINVLIVCSSCNVSQSPPMYQCKQAWVFWWPFSPPCGGNDKHQKRNNKKTCQVIILEGLDVNWDKGICKDCWTSTWTKYGTW